MMKRLLLVLGLVAWIGYAFAGKTTQFFYAFPTFYGVVTNVTSVYFFGDDGSATQGALVQTGADVADTTNLTECIEEAVSGLSSVTLGSASTNLTLSCEFAPSDVNKSAPTVSYPSSMNPGSPPADGELIVITNDSDNWKITVTVSGDVPGFGDVYVRPAYVKSDHSIADKNNTGWKSLTGGGQVFTNADAYSTTYRFVYAIPMLFKMTITEPAASPRQQFTVTWNAANL